MTVRLNFTVSTNGLPALLIIRSFDGRLILYRRIYDRQNSLCVCVDSRNIIVTVRPFNADFYEKSYFLKLGCRPCYNIRLNFVFTAAVVGTIQRFYLIDENYLFPIANATLFFSGGG